MEVSPERKNGDWGVQFSVWVDVCFRNFTLVEELPGKMVIEQFLPPTHVKEFINFVTLILSYLLDPWRRFVTLAFMMRNILCWKPGNALCGELKIEAVLRLIKKTKEAVVR